MSTMKINIIVNNEPKQQLLQKEYSTDESSEVGNRMS